MKAQTLDRIELTKRKMAFKEAIKHADDIPAYPGVEELLREENERKKNGDFCPVCGRTKLIHESGCVKCIACGWSKCG